MIMNKTFFGVFLLLCIVLTGCKKEANKLNNSDDKELRITVERADENLFIDKNIIDYMETDEIVDNDENEANEQEDEQADTQELEPESITFYDVFRNEYSMITNPKVKRNTLKDECFSYSGVDKTGKILSEIEILEDTDIFVPGTEAVGYPGIIGYEDENYTSKFGIDVSKFQGNVDWEKVKEAGVQFVFVRVGFRGYGQSGSLSEDAKYKQNISGARNAGLDVGVYFYAQAIDEVEAVEEAEFVLDLISDYEITLPVVYDPEHVLNDTARTDNVTGEQFTKNTRAFCDRIREAGYTPMVYANMLWEANELDLSEVGDVEIWYADYELKPQSPYEFKVWQYSQAGHITGIDGTVDLNMMIEKK